MSVTYLHEPLWPSEPLHGDYICAPDFQPTSVNAAIFFREKDWAEASSFRLFGGSLWDSAPDCHGVFIDDCKMDLHDCLIRGFRRHALFAKGWHDSQSEGLYVSDCGGASGSLIHMNHNPGRLGSFCHDLTFQRTRIGDSWGDSQHANRFRGGNYRGGDGFTAHTVTNLRIEDMRIRGEHFGSIKPAFCTNVHISNLDAGSLQFAGGEGYSLRNSTLHKSTSGSLSHEGGQVLMVTDGCAGAVIDGVHVSCHKSSEARERDEDLIAFQITGGSVCHAKDMTLIGPGDVGVDLFFSGPSNGAFGPSSLTTEGRWIVEGFEIPWRVR